MGFDPFDPMKYIWDQVSQPAPDGKRQIKYAGRGDLEYLYSTGFVDTDKFTLAEWIDAFQDSLQPDGGYLLSEDQWMEKRPYRYEGSIEEPFNPFKLRDGEWEPEDFERLLKEKILPSLAIDEKNFREAIEKAKGQIFARGKYLMNNPLKNTLKLFLEQHPSPRRVREVSFAEAKAKLPRQGVGVTPPPSRSGQPSSSFSLGPAKAQVAIDQLSRLLKK